MIYRLIVLSGARTGEHITIGTEPMVIGSGADCGLRFCDEELAPQHAVIEHRLGGVFVRDLASMAGVILNHRRVSEARLKHGDILELGRTSCLVEVSVRADVKNRPFMGSRRRRVAVWGVALAVIASTFLAYSFYSSFTKGKDATPSVAALAGGDIGVLLELKDVAGAAEEADEAQAKEAALDLKTALSKRSPVISVLDNIIPIDQNQLVLAEEKELTQPQLAGLVFSDMANSNIWNELLVKAQEMAAIGRLADADQLLTSLQIAAPDFWPAYEERARLFEQRGLLKKAVDQWNQLVKLCSADDWQEKGTSERRRILEAEELIGANPQKKLRMVAVEEFKFPPTKDSEEVRAINISLAPTIDSVLLDPDAVKVQVVFYDLVKDSESVVPTEAGVVTHPLHPDGDWPKNETKVVTATYTAPANIEQAAPNSGQYYGYCVRVYYNEQLQDELARPKSLLAITEKKIDANISVVAARSGK